MSRRKARRVEAERRASWESSDTPYVIATSSYPLAEARRQAAGGGAFLGWLSRPSDGARVWVSAAEDSAVCVLAPPRAGKTTGVVTPSVIAAPGPVIVTSTKRDVLDATSAIRLCAGECWLFDPSGREAPPPGVEVVRWSPVVSAGTWDTSRVVARSMVAAAVTVSGGANSGSSGEAHFTDKATDTLAPMLYAAHHAGLSMTDVADWLYQADPAEALDLLAEHVEGGGPGANGAADRLAGVGVGRTSRRSPSCPSGCRPPGATACTWWWCSRTCPRSPRGGVVTSRRGSSRCVRPR